MTYIDDMHAECLTFSIIKFFVNISDVLFLAAINYEVEINEKKEP